MDTTIRLGAISFINTIPVYNNLMPDPSIEVIYDTPAGLNRKLLSGELDVSPISSACYLQNPQAFALLDDLSVSSPGAVESVLFLSNKAMGKEMLDHAVIAVPDDSETSIMLLAWLLKEATGRDLRPWFQTYPAGKAMDAFSRYGNALVIGDHALLIQQAGLLPGTASYDLSSLWKERTGLPFVFAVWAARRDWAEAHPAQCHALNRKLCMARERFLSIPAVFEAGLTLAHAKSGLPPESLSRYYRKALHYRLAKPEQASLALFGRILDSAANWEASTRAEQQPVG